ACQPELGSSEVQRDTEPRVSTCQEMLPFTSPPVVMKSVSFNMSTQSTLEEAPEEAKKQRSERPKHESSL
ncbi:unnamed protein product, partial [Durusdinium trenchii]